MCRILVRRYINSLSFNSSVRNGRISAVGNKVDSRYTSQYDDTRTHSRTKSIHVLDSMRRTMDPEHVHLVPGWSAPRLVHARLGTRVCTICLVLLGHIAPHRGTLPDRFRTPVFGCLSAEL